MLHSIRSLRGVAALLVVIYHAYDYAKSHGHPRIEEMFAHGAFGVDLFFIISGYVMLLSIEKNRTSNTKISASRFLIHRIIRVAPIYWIGTTLLYAIYIAQPHRFKTFTASFDNFAQSILFLPVLRTESESTISPVLSQGWTLYHEFYFYLTLATLIALRFGRNIIYAAPLLILAIASFGAIAVESPARPWFELILSPINVEFALGCAIFLITQKLKPRISNSTALIVLISSILVLLCTPDLSKVHDFQRTTAWGIPAAFIFFSAITLENTLKKKLEYFNKYVGDPSYSIYIFHGLTFSAVDLLLKQLNTTLPPTAFIYTLCAGSLIAGNILYQFLELPLTSRLNRTWNRLSENKSRK